MGILDSRCALGRLGHSRSLLLKGFPVYSRFFSTVKCRAQPVTLSEADSIFRTLTTIINRICHLVTDDFLICRCQVVGRLASNLNTILPCSKYANYANDPYHTWLSFSSYNGH